MHAQLAQGTFVPVNAVLVCMPGTEICTNTAQEESLLMSSRVGISQCRSSPSKLVVLAVYQLDRTLLVLMHLPPLLDGCTNTHEPVQENAREVATREGRPVKHPLIDRVRECSATPRAAADFFCLLFQFKPEKRLLHDAACHTYLSATFDRMKAAPSISWDSSSDVVEGERPSVFVPFDTAIRLTSCNFISRCCKRNLSCSEPC
jgi:hypothetical protein